jgi:toxin CptA
MHSAPAVTYPVGRSRFALAFLAFAWLAGGTGIALWRMKTAPTSMPMFIATAAILIPGAMALRGWLRSPQGMLAWNGEGWTWAANGQGEPGTPDAVLDLQSIVLLRWNCGNKSQWLWLERALLPSRWDDLRRAVYSRVPKP